MPRRLFRILPVRLREMALVPISLMHHDRDLKQPLLRSLTPPEFTV